MAQVLHKSGDLSKVNVQELMLAYASCVTAKSLKAEGGIRSKFDATRLYGQPLTTTSLDVEAKVRTTPTGKIKSATILTIGLNAYHFTKNQLVLSPVTQIITEKMDSVDAVYQALLYMKRNKSDAFSGYYIKFDMEILKGFSLSVRERYPNAPPLPRVMIDLFPPFRGLGCTASQEHIGRRFMDEGKGHVDEDIWDTATTGAKDGKTPEEVHAAYNAIKYERNMTCLRHNLLDTIFFSRNTDILNKPTITDVYPLFSKMEAYEA